MHSLRDACILSVIGFLCAPDPLGAVPPRCGDHVSVIAVMDFRPRTVSEEADRLQKFLTEALITEFSRRPGMRVVERERLQPIISELNLSRTGAISPQTQRDIGRALSADFVLTGNFLIRGSTITIHTNLNNVRKRPQHLETQRRGQISDIGSKIDTIVASVEKYIAGLADLEGACPSVSDRSKPIVAVLPFSSEQPSDERNLGERVAHSLAKDLIRTNRFVVVERSRLEALLDEQRLAQSGAVDPRTAVAVGRLLGASWLIYGSIHGEKADLRRVHARIVGVETGEIRSAAKYEAPRDELFAKDIGLAESVLRNLGSPSELQLTTDLQNIQVRRGEEAAIYRRRASEILKEWEIPFDKTRIGAELAAWELRKAVFVEPTNGEHYLALAKFYRGMRAWDRSIRVLHSLISRYPGLIQDGRQYADGLFQLGKSVKCESGASDYYERFLRTGEFPERAPFVRRWILACDQKSGDNDRALRNAEGLWKEGDRTGEFLAKIGWLRERAGKFEGAEEAYRLLKVVQPIRGVGPLGLDARGTMTSELRLGALARCRDLGWEPWVRFLELEASTGSASADLLELARAHPDHPAGEFALALLLEIHHQRQASTPLGEKRKVFRSLIREFPHIMNWPRMQVYYPGGIEFKERWKDQRWLYENVPLDDERRLFALATWAYGLHRYGGDGKAAAELYRRMLAEGAAMPSTPVIRSDMASAKENLMKIEYGITGFSRNSAPMAYSHAVKWFQDSGPTTGGQGFYVAGAMVEAIWAFEKAEQEKGLDIFNYLRLGRTWECLQIWTEAVAVYQNLIDRRRYTHVDTAKQAQARIDGILRDHPIGASLRTEDVRRVGVLREITGAMSIVSVSDSRWNERTDRYRRLAGIVRDGHGHCELPETNWLPLDDPSLNLSEVINRILPALVDSRQDRRREAADLLPGLARLVHGSLKDAAATRQFRLVLERCLESEDSTLVEKAEAALRVFASDDRRFTPAPSRDGPQAPDPAPPRRR